jgi:hypothetical protein
MVKSTFCWAIRRDRQVGGNNVAATVVQGCQKLFAGRRHERNSYALKL